MAESIDRPLTGCAMVRLTAGEPLFATAPERATTWLLVEHPGPWPSEGVPAGMPAEVERVWHAAGEAGVRWQWIRPVDGRRHSPATVFVARTVPGECWMERRVVDDLRALAELDVTAMADGRPPGFGAGVDQRVVLVCTHGRRDVCCARLGRPVAVRLDGRLPGLVWETTHVGGHRFAANVVTLPDGSYHGGITAVDVDRLADSVSAGRVIPARLRGRSGLSAAAQAADYYARIRLGVLRVDAVVPVAEEAVGTRGMRRVELDVDGGRYAVYIRPRMVAEPRPTSCAAAGRSAPTTFDLVAFSSVPAVGQQFPVSAGQ